MLIEMPQGHWSDEMLREVADIWEKRDILPILAHIDRYIAPWRAQKLIRRVSQLPVYVQANAEFFLNRSTAPLALRMLRADQIQLLGSDCHNLRSRRPNLGEAVEVIQRKLGPDVLETVCGYECRVMEF